MAEEKQHLSLKKMVDNQIARVLERGNRAERFDQLRSRHFWSSYLFIADPVTFQIAAGGYDIFKVIPSGTGQGYPTNVPLTIRETNWLNGGRVPDNQNFVITEIGVTLKRPPATDVLGSLAGAVGSPLAAPSNGLWANLPTAIQAAINHGAQAAPIVPSDANAILYGGILEMSFLTNNVPLGLLADFSQSSGLYVGGQGVPSFITNGIVTDAGPPATTNYTAFDTVGDPVNGIPAAAFRRKLEVPILLQHGENMGMRINFPRNIQITSPSINPSKATSPQGTGWFEIRVDWWAHESFVEKS